MIHPHLPAKYFPLRDTGDGLQSGYLAGFPSPMTGLLVELTGGEYWSALKELQGEAEDQDIVGVDGHLPCHL